MKKLITLSLIILSLFAQAQVDSTLFKRTEEDISLQQLNMDAVYNRPFLTSGKSIDISDDSLPF